jgi:NTP pyrophosphatase (non-canonical NTP hydrolase)
LTNEQSSTNSLQNELNVFAALAIHNCGSDFQISKCIEESLELSVELKKLENGKGDADKIIDELADAIITCNTVIHLFGKERLENKVREKINRAKERFKEGKC